MLVVVTGNKRKREEMKEVLDGRVEYEFFELDQEEIQGEVEDIAKRKAFTAYEKIKKPVLVEDYALEIESLGGMPGPYVKQFLPALPKTIETLKSSLDSVRARVICTYAYYDGREMKLFIGEKEGRLERTSGKGFGADPYFILDGMEETLSHLSITEKNKVSARGMALRKVIEELGPRK